MLTNNLLEKFNWTGRLNENRELSLFDSMRHDAVMAVEYQENHKLETVRTQLTVSQRGTWICFDIEEYNQETNRTKQTSMTLELDQWEALKKHIINAGMNI